MKRIGGSNHFAAISVVTAAVAAVVIRSDVCMFRSGMRDFWQTGTKVFTDRLWSENFRLSQNASNELCGAIEQEVD